MNCLYCGTAVPPAAERCSQCDAVIVWKGDAAEFLVPEDYVPVHVGTDPALLLVVKSLLAANGIPFFVTDEISQDFLSWGRFIAGYSPVTGPPVVKVPGRMAQAAHDLIASAQPTSEEATAES